MKALILVVCLTVGCSTLDKQAPNVDAPSVSRRLSMETRKYDREPGSIWTEGSSWNNLFTDILPRKNGDLVRVRFTEAFRAELSKRLKKDPKGKLETLMDEFDIALQIEEIYRPGVFGVSGLRNLRFGDERVSLNVQATVREKDLLKDDSLTWDQLYNLQWSIQAEGKKS